MKLSIVIVSAVLLASASAYRRADQPTDKSVARGTPKIQSKCLLTGGVKRIDIFQLAQDVYNLDVQNLLSDKNLCILTCVFVEKVHPVMALYRHMDMVKGLLGCVSTSEPNVCAKAHEVLQCLTSQAVSIVLKILPENMKLF